MNRLFTFCSSFLISLCLFAQTTTVKTTIAKANPANSFCSTIKIILDNRHNDFRDLYTRGFTRTITDVNNYAVDAVNGIGSSEGYDSKLKVPGAKASFISYKTIQGEDYKTFYAYWGKYKTKAPADKKNVELKKQLIACLGDHEAIEVPGEKVEQFKNHMQVFTRFEFRNKRPEKRNEPKISLLFERDAEYDDENVIFLMIEGNSFMKNETVQSPVEDNNQATKNNFDGIPDIYTTPVNDFCKRLSEIMFHAHTNFEKITTEEQQVHEDQRDGPDVMQLFSLGYKASLNFPGAKQSSVVPGVVGADSYEAYFGSYKTMSEAEKKIDSLKIQLTPCLVNYKTKKETAAEKSDSYKLSYIFDEKRSDKVTPQHVTLIIEEDNDWGDEDLKKVFKVYLYIYGLRK